MVPGMSKRQNSLSVSAAALLLAGTIASPAFAACLSGGDIQQAIGSGQIRPLADILVQAGIGRDSKVLQPVNVCDHGGELYYELSILDKDGNARKLRLHALTGAS
jgi:hypothetical protein